MANHQDSDSALPVGGSGDPGRLRLAVHDLRGSLGAISSAARLLSISAADPEQVQKTANVIQRQVQLLGDRINQLAAELQNLTDAPEPASPALPENQPARAARDQNIPLRVLVVDDDRGAAHMLKRLLETLGCMVEAVNSGEAALALLVPFAPELIFTDLEMDGMSGDELAREIRTRNPDPRPQIVALSGHDISHPDAVINRAFDRLLTKPADMDELERLVQQCREGAL